MFEITTSIPAVLAQADIFSELSPEQLELIASISSVTDHNTGDLIFEENSASQELYIIFDGEVDIQIDPSLFGESNRFGPLTLTTLRRGQSFGEMALIDQGLRSASARCAQDETRLVVIPREALMDLCRNYPELGYFLMRNLAVDLASKIRDSGFQMREWLTWARGGAAA